MSARAWIGVAGLTALLATSVAAAEIHDDHLTAFSVAEGAIPQSLTGKPGDPARGKSVAADRGLGNCIACHAMPIPQQLDYGNIGPDLAGVGGRLSEGQLRLRIVNPKLVNPLTPMPAFYRVDGLVQVARNAAGKPILSADQVEDVVAYLMTLK
jgi:L-cysteine S-thiosulfotransferase